MGWQEYPENDENYLPLTEDELKEFQIKSEQVCFTALLPLPSHAQVVCGVVLTDTGKDKGLKWDCRAVNDCIIHAVWV